MFQGSCRLADVWVSPVFHGASHKPFTKELHGTRSPEGRTAYGQKHHPSGVGCIRSGGPDIAWKPTSVLLVTPNLLRFRACRYQTPTKQLLYKREIGDSLLLVSLWQQVIELVISLHCMHCWPDNSGVTLWLNLEFLTQGHIIKFCESIDWPSIPMQNCRVFLAVPSK